MCTSVWVCVCVGVCAGVCVGACVSACAGGCETEGERDAERECARVLCVPASLSVLSASVFVSVCFRLVLACVGVVKGSERGSAESGERGDKEGACACACECV